MFNCLRPLPHAIEVTKRLKDKHELFVMAASYPENLEVKMNWLHIHFPHIPYRNVIICQRKDLINVDLLIDNAAHNIENFLGDTIVIDYAWNRHLQGYKRRG